MNQTGEDIYRKIKFNFGLYKSKKDYAVVRKDDNGNKRRYLCGVASGTGIDAHGERLTEKCIAGLHDQAISASILATADLHGKGATDDVGKLTYSKILKNGDWYIEVRLYDEYDGFDKGSRTLEVADKIWWQVTGTGPYKDDPKQKGFSIEGYIPSKDDILSMDQDGGSRVINKIKLQFVTIVPDPAYKSSIIQSIQKALGEKTIYAVRKEAGKEFHKIIREKDDIREYWDTRFDLDSALEEMLRRIMEGDDYDKRSSLEAVFTEYQNSVINLMLENPEAYGGSDPKTSPDDVSTVSQSEEEPATEDDRSDALDQEDKERLKKIKQRISSVRIKKKE